MAEDITFLIRDVYEMVRENFPNASSSQMVLQVLTTAAGREPCDCGTEEERTKISLNNILKNMNRNWRRLNSHRDRFEADRMEWLDRNCIITKCDNCQPDPEHAGAAAAPANEIQPWMDLSRWSRWRRVNQIINRHGTDELKEALGKRLKNKGMSIVAKRIKRMIAGDWQDRFSPIKALTMMVEMRLSVRQYNMMRLNAKEINHDIYPSYHQVQEEKNSLMPANIVSSEREASINLQALLDKTSERTIETAEIPADCHTLTLIGKWGLDGSTCHSDWKIRPEHVDIDEDGNRIQIVQEDTSFDTIFSVAYVPLILFNSNNPEEVYWKNKRPSSSALLPLHPTMADQKVIAALLNIESAQTCPVCLANPVDMNNPELLSLRIENPAALRYGVSSMHAWIRACEHILHIAYRLDFQEWRVSTNVDDPNRILFNNRKKRIQDDVRRLIGPLVDMPLASGKGNTTDGNTARRLFSNPALFSEITGVNLNFITRMRNILVTLAQDFSPINVELFRQYCMQTEVVYLQHYRWYYLPSSIHKILRHSASIIQSFSLPIGVMSEEALESRTKDIRYIREHHTRKMSRDLSNMDLLRGMLVTSDPIVDSNRRKITTKPKPLPPAVLEMLIDEELADDSMMTTEDDTSMDESD